MNKVFGQTFQPVESVDVATVEKKIFAQTSLSLTRHRVPKQQGNHKMINLWYVNMFGQKFVKR